MKKNRGRLMSLLLLTGFLAALSLVITSLDLTGSKPDYTVFNYQKSGTSLLYDVLRGMGFKTEPEYQKVGKFSDTQSARIFIEPDYSFFNAPDKSGLFDFTAFGGMVIYLSSAYPSDDTELILSGAQALFKKGEYTLWSYGYGEILTGPPNVTNGILLTDTSAGYYVSDVIARWEADVLINEACHGYLSSPGAWDVTPVNMKNAAYQLIVTALVIILYLGKRFGKPVPLYEELEREENEYLTALANVYRKAGDGYTVYETGLERFLSKASARFHLTPGKTGTPALAEAVLSEWKRRGKPHYEDLLFILDCYGERFNTNRHKGRKKLLAAMRILDILENSL